MIRPCVMAVLAGAIAVCALAADDAPPPEAFRVREQPLSPGPRITPFLQYQAEQAWREDNDRQRAWDGIHNERELLRTQDQARRKLLQMIGGLPAAKTRQWGTWPIWPGRILPDGRYGMVSARWIICSHALKLTASESALPAQAAAGFRLL